ncbi:sulfur carrier protein ThiS [Hoeflea prorocentri]|uniref:Sulfur carrier protein ThiS n=1 Tax=Hoeflea prorocentri TaxID=1922333 RepID=A0A9X3ZHP8_9HYPH|nr:sulfur carrier protein ThiS [Hoeflea prorocentri]MCY6381163.1 sulfur carrier protein ThiS [Hoeflea prorocentri]MDA5398963.1 sulfur carrier protein ThiS [Hoeflea prorocentri]
MDIVINGQPVKANARRLDVLLSEFSYEGDWLATAVNGELIRREERVSFVLSDGDRVEILSPMQGG